MKNKEAVIIIGGGASGLLAARELLKKKRKIILLEARDRLGGRAHTFYQDEVPIEVGAEFIHGKLPISFKLIKKYKLSVYETGGRMVNLDKADEQLQEDQGKGWDLMMNKMKKLKKDMPLAVFLSKYFSDEKFEHLRKSAENFANGFDLADPEQASTFSLREEWESEQHEQYRIEGGYSKLIDALANDCIERGGKIFIEEIVRKIAWDKKGATAITNTGKKFTADKILITIPAGVMHSQKNAASIKFIPSIPKKINAYKEIGYGSIIKLVLVFKTAFWEEKYKNAGFFFVKEKIPTWWTQAPEKSNLITGWLGGVPAKKMKGKSEQELLSIALEALSAAFDLEKKFLEEQLVASHLFNWDDDLFSCGGYSFSKVGSAPAKRELRKPINNILFFAGEALYDGTLQGTVEAAFESAVDRVKKMTREKKGRSRKGTRNK